MLNKCLINKHKINHSFVTKTLKNQKSKTNKKPKALSKLGIKENFLHLTESLQKTEQTSYIMGNQTEAFSLM